MLSRQRLEVPPCQFQLNVAAALMGYWLGYLLLSEGGLRELRPRQRFRITSAGLLDMLLILFVVR